MALADGALLMLWSSLHHHSTFSFLDGYGTPEQHVGRAEELEMSAFALTEHGNVSSHVRHEKAALKAGVKPIFGCELYTGAVDDEKRDRFKWHLTVLAENVTGYRNLLRLVSRGWAEGYHYEPTVSGDMLAEHSDGLVVLSGCGGSKMACDLLGGKGVLPHQADLGAATRTAARFRDLLGDRFYLEVQSFPELERTRDINQAWTEVGARLGIPLVATGDVHYPRPDDNDMQVVLHAVGRGGQNNTFEKQAQSWGYDVRLTAPLTDRAVWERVRGTGLTGAQAEAAIRTAAEIAERCTVTLPKADRLRYPVDQEGAPDARTLFRWWLRRGWNYRRIDDRPNRSAYTSRIKYEIDMIEAKDFVDYFLMLSDAVRATKDAGIPVGPARGSAAASLACYLLRITEVDPMDFPMMLFERFIDITREDLPDVDLDFDDEQRDFVRQHLVARYGADRVGNIGNFVKYRGKNAVTDIGRVHRLPFDATTIVKNLVIERSGGDSRFDASLADTAEMFPQAAAQFEAHPELWQAVRLEGNMRGMSVHAAGIVVANSPINDFCATYTRTSGKDKRPLSVLSVDKYDAEHLGLMKIDALGLATMGMIRIALERSGLTLDDLYAIPLTDEDTLAAFKRGDVVGIFQFEGRATRLVNRDVSPDNFSELVDINALSRPGPLFSGATAAYVDTKHGRIPRMTFHPAVDRLTHNTQGQIIYQEQILQIVREVGGFPWTHASAIRRIISQKKGEAAFNAMQQQFLDGAQELHDIDQELGLRIWRQLVTSGTYAFNIAHSVSYSMLGFWCQWLKQHHTPQFYTAQLRKTEPLTGKALEAKGDVYGRLLRDADKHGVKVLPPDPNWSAATWEIENDGIRAGLQQVHTIGEKLAEAILVDRNERGWFDNWTDLQRVKGIGPKKLEAIQAHADNDDPFGLERVGKKLAAIRKWLGTPQAAGLPRPTHTGNQAADIEIAKAPGGGPGRGVRLVYLGVPEARNYQDYIENQRARTGEEVEEIRARMRRPDLVTSCVLKCVDDGDEEVYLRFGRFKFPDFKDMLEELVLRRDMVLVIGSKVDGFGTAVYVDKMWTINPDED